VYLKKLLRLWQVSFNQYNLLLVILVGVEICAKLSQLFSDKGCLINEDVKNAFNSLRRKYIYDGVLK
jgi:hypothetical protein